MKFTAIDFTCDAGSPVEWFSFLVMRRREGSFAGGLGLYVKQGFVHIDGRGRNATWGV